MTHTHPLSLEWEKTDLLCDLEDNVVNDGGAVEIDWSNFLTLNAAQNKHKIFNFKSIF